MEKTHDIYDSEVCPSALNEDGTSAFDPPAHKWSEEPCESEECNGTQKECSECGALLDCDNGITA